jgi:hypothetical protein
MAVPTRAAAAYTHGNETDGWTIDWPGHPSSLSDTAGSSDTAGLSDTAGSSDIAGSELQPPVQQPAQVVTSAAAVVSLAPQEVVAAYDMERILCHKADRGRLRRTQPYKKHDHLSGGLPPLVGTPTNCSHPAAAAAAAVAARARAPLSPAWIYILAGVAADTNIPQRVRLISYILVRPQHHLHATRHTLTPYSSRDTAS